LVVFTTAELAQSQVNRIHAKKQIQKIKVLFDARESYFPFDNGETTETAATLAVVDKRTE
jgi:hypothetical protein